MRLDKLLSQLGYGSRKVVKEIIRKGKVLVNGELIKNDDYKVDELVDEIIVFDVKTNYQKNIYLMLNKPSGVITATYDNYHQTVMDLIKEYKGYDLFPVGRLDIDTEGLLLITNDGVLAHKLLSPKNHVNKKYYVKLASKIENKLITIFADGITLKDGYKTKKASLEIINDNECFLTITEGKFHQAKRMFESVNNEVIYLKRVSFHHLRLDESLEKGEYRLLSDAEVNSLKEGY